MTPSEAQLDLWQQAPWRASETDVSQLVAALRDARAETAELRARIEAVCDEHQCDETCELIDCEHPAGYWVSIERVRAALFPAEEAPSE